MYGLELKRILLRAPLLFLVVFFVPLFILTCFVPGFVKLSAMPKDIQASIETIDSRLDALSSTFEGLANTSYNYRQELRNKWIDFGGFSKTGAGGKDAYGLYWNFYQAEGLANNGADLSDAYDALQPVFMIFYNAYQEYIINTRMLFIRKKDYDRFTKGIESLHKYFSVKATDYVELNRGRGRCHEIRKKTNFREIIENMRRMTLTEKQTESLKNSLAYINETRATLPQGTVDEQMNYLDFCDTAYTYLTYRMNIYVVKNANFKTRIYYGFTEMGKNRKDIKRFEYMLKNNKTNADYSRPLAFLSVMHTPTGTTTFDFAYNGFMIITIPLILLAVIVTVFCIFNDIKQKTVVGAIVSPNSRRKIILSKLLACYTAILIVVALFCAMYFILGAILVGSAAAPPVLFVMFGKIYIMSPLMYFLMFMGVLVLKLLFFMTLTAVLCVKSKGKLSPVFLASLLCIGLAFAHHFLMEFTIYQIIIIPVFILVFTVCLCGTVLSFRKKDF